MFFVFLQLIQKQEILPAPATIKTKQNKLYVNFINNLNAINNVY